VVAYGTSPPPADAIGYREIFLAAHPELRASRILLFLGRIHEKKGCDLLIETFAKVSMNEPTLRLVMAGPGRPALVDHLKVLAKNRGISDRVIWPGMLQGEMKWGAFYSAEAFVLPSHQENFGIAVAEALGCGLPVLISEKVNIWREILLDNAGLADKDTQSGTDALIRRWLELSEQSRREMKSNAKHSFEARFTVEAMANDIIELINGAPQ
jgi:glycosyltransferase involved in cell wall biosynthesis